MEGIGAPVWVELSGDLWHAVAGFLAGPDLARCTAACGALRVCASSEKLWQRLCSSRFARFERGRMLLPGSALGAPLPAWKAFYAHHHRAALPRASTVLLSVGGNSTAKRLLVPDLPASSIPRAAPPHHHTHEAQHLFYQRPWAPGFRYGDPHREGGASGICMACSPHGNVVALCEGHGRPGSGHGRAPPGLVLVHTPPLQPGDIDPAVPRLARAATGAVATIRREHTATVQLGEQVVGAPFCLTFAPDGSALLFLAPTRSRQGGLGLFAVDLGCWPSSLSSQAGPHDAAPAPAPQLRPRRLLVGAPLFFSVSPDSCRLLVHAGGQQQSRCPFGGSTPRTQLIVVPLDEPQRDDRWREMEAPSAGGSSGGSWGGGGGGGAGAGAGAGGGGGGGGAEEGRLDWEQGPRSTFALADAPAFFNTPQWAWLWEAGEDVLLFLARRDPTNPHTGADLVAQRAPPRDWPPPPPPPPQQQQQQQPLQQPGAAAPVAATWQGQRRVLASLPPEHAASFSLNQPPPRPPAGCERRVPSLLAFSSTQRMQVPGLGACRMGALAVVRLEPFSAASSTAAAAQVVVPQMLRADQPATADAAARMALVGALSWAPSGATLAFLELCPDADLRWCWSVAVWDEGAQRMAFTQRGDADGASTSPAHCYFHLPQLHFSEWLPFFDQYLHSYSFWHEEGGDVGLLDEEGGGKCDGSGGGNIRLRGVHTRFVFSRVESHPELGALSLVQEEGGAASFEWVPLLPTVLDEHAVDFAVWLPQSPVRYA